MKDANLTPTCESGDEYQAFADRKTDLFNSLKDYLLAGEKEATSGRGPGKTGISLFLKIEAFELHGG